MFTQTHRHMHTHRVSSRLNSYFTLTQSKLFCGNSGLPKLSGSHLKSLLWLLAFCHKAFLKASSLLGWYRALCLCAGELIIVKTVLTHCGDGPRLYISQRARQNLVLLANVATLVILHMIPFLPFRSLPLFLHTCFLGSPPK